MAATSENAGVIATGFNVAASIKMRKSDRILMEHPGYISFNVAASIKMRKYVVFSLEPDAQIPASMWPHL